MHQAARAMHRLHNPGGATSTKHSLAHQHQAILTSMLQLISDPIKTKELQSLEASTTSHKGSTVGGTVSLPMELTNLGLRVRDKDTVASLI